MSAASKTPRAGLVITGTEVITGTRTDRNGPWLSRRLRESGVDVAYVSIVGDRPSDVGATLRFMVGEGLDLVITSGGLGPTADDLTAAMVAEVQGVEMVLDEPLEQRIAAIVEPLRKRFENLDTGALAAGTRKQAMVPEGATVLEPVGTAPGLVVPPGGRAGSDGREGGDGPTIVALPGPPRELQPMFEVALGTDLVRAALAGVGEIREGVMRIFGIPESEIAATLRAAEQEGVALGDLEITTCLHNGEIEVSTTYAPEASPSYLAFQEFVRGRHGAMLFSTDGATVDEQVAQMLVASGTTIATAESCTGGLLAARLTDLAGSSRYFRGGVVAYANEAKGELAGVAEALIERHGAVSAEVAEALADGARGRLGTEVGVGVTGVAGPDGGTPEKPVGLVWVSAARGAKHLTRSVTLPGSRGDVRARATTVAMHLLRRLLADSGATVPELASDRAGQAGTSAP
jgi:nicotinamide-nucleotide amidase